jgi:hypothetical protein
MIHAEKARRPLVIQRDRLHKTRRAAQRRAAPHSVSRGLGVCALTSHLARSLIMLHNLSAPRARTPPRRRTQPGAAAVAVDPNDGYEEEEPPTRTAPLPSPPLPAFTTSVHSRPRTPAVIDPALTDSQSRLRASPFPLRRPSLFCGAPPWLPELAGGAVCLF